MRYAPNHKEETREKLLESSRAIAKKGGFAHACLRVMASESNHVCSFPLQASSFCAERLRFDQWLSFLV